MSNNAEAHITLDDVRTILLERLDDLREAIESQTLADLYEQLSQMPDAQLLQTKAGADQRFRRDDRLVSIVCALLYEVRPASGPVRRSTKRRRKPAADTTED